MELFYLAAFLPLFFFPMAVYGMGNPAPSWGYEPFGYYADGIVAWGRSNMAPFDRVNLYVYVEPYESELLTAPGTMTFHSKLQPGVVRVPHSYKYRLLDGEGRELIQSSVSIDVEGQSEVTLEDLDAGRVRVRSSNTRISNGNGIETLKEYVAVPPGGTLEVEYNLTGFWAEGKDFWIDLQALGVPAQIQCKAILVGNE